MPSSARHFFLAFLSVFAIVAGAKSKLIFTYGYSNAQYAFPHRESPFSPRLEGAKFGSV